MSKNLLFVRQDIGTGKPIVLLHGMFGDGTQWRVIADLLSDYYRVIVLDLLGHGKSPRPQGANYTPGEHSRALRQTLEKLGATKDATVVGYSMGGTVALQYAAEYQDVSQLFMISTPFYLKPEEMVEAGYSNSLLYTKFSVGLFRQVDKLLRPNKLLYKLVEKDDLMKWLHVLIDAYDNKLDPEVTRLNLKHLINEYEFAKTLSRVKAPITFYSGKRDVFVVRGQLRALKKVQPLMEAETLGIVKNDHMLVQYLPQQMVKVLTRYHQQTLHINKVIGKGETYVLLHGIETSSAYWNNFADALSKKYRVITIDLLGFGRSPKPLNIAYSLEDQVAWLERTLSEKGIKKFSLMGHSLGSLVAFTYAAKHPKQIKRLIVTSPVFVNDSKKQHRFIIRNLKYINYFSESGYLLSSIAKAIGQKRLSKFTPTIRSVNNAVKSQDTLVATASMKPNSVDIIYGDNDPLVDVHELAAIKKKLKWAEITRVEGGTHNFPITMPNKLMEIIEPKLSSEKIKKTKAQPKRLVRQLVRLAAPFLLLKGCFLLVAGFLLFSQYKEEVLVGFVGAAVMVQSAQFIRGSFSLKNEGLSYIGYFSIGIFGVLLGYLLATHFAFTLKVAVIIVCGFILLNSLSRLLAAMFWTTDKKLKRRLIVSGLILFIVSLSAFLGSLMSVYLIVYAIAIYLIIRSFVYLFYLTISLLAAYARSL